MLHSDPPALGQTRAPRSIVPPSRPGADPVDVHVGLQMCKRRKAFGLSQSDFGALLGDGPGDGVTFQQVQKYERGHNRISASRLYRAAVALEVGVSSFFERLPTNGKALASESAAKRASREFSASRQGGKLVGIAQGLRPDCVDVLIRVAEQLPKAD